MNRKWLLIGAVVLIIVGAGAYFGYQQLQAANDEDVAVIAEVTVRVENDPDVVNAEGRVIPRWQATLA